MIELVHASVINQHVDAIVNAANSGLLGGGGVDGAIHKIAGPKLDAACQKLHDDGGCPTGEAVITCAYGITWARHIIHTVGPVYSADDADDCAKKLESCYVRSCDLALLANDRSIAFPAISCGIYGYPFRDACLIELQSLTMYENRFDRIVLAMFKQQEYDDAYAIVREVTECHAIGDGRIQVCGIY